MKISVYEKKARFLRSHRVNRTLESPTLPGYYILECCKEYIFVSPFGNPDIPLIVKRWPHRWSDMCTYHSRFEIINKGSSYSGGNAFTTVSCHKLAQCPCLGFLVFSNAEVTNPFRLGEIRVPIKIESSNMMKLPPPEKLLGRYYW